MTGLRQDLRYLLHQLRRSPGFTALVVTTLAMLKIKTMLES
jgi:hypothetical protein